MKPAVSSKKKAVIPAVLVGAFAFYWYFKPFPWLGVIMAILAGLFTFYILSTKRMERLRRPFFIALFAIALIALINSILSMGMDRFMEWVKIHVKEYYIPGQTIGALSYPCTKVVPQVLLGRADFLVGIGKWQTTLPSNLNEFLVGFRSQSYKAAQFIEDHKEHLKYRTFNYSDEKQRLELHELVNKELLTKVNVLDYLNLSNPSN